MAGLNKKETIFYAGRKNKTCCIAEGFSKPYAYIPLSKSSFKSIASKVVHISSQFVAISSELKD